MDSKMKLSWEGLGVILANLGRLWGSFSAHFRGLGGGLGRVLEGLGGVVGTLGGNLGSILGSS